MKRKVFFSFHYKEDSWRASQVRNMGVVEGNESVSDNDWEEVKRGGDKSIETWINEQIKDKSCVVVLVGSETAGRKWIDYEIQKAWADKKGVVGIYIHGLKDQDKKISTKGKNPFDKFTIPCGDDKKSLSSIVKCYNPPGSFSTERYEWIADNLSNIVEEAIKIRKDPC